MWLVGKGHRQGHKSQKCSHETLVSIIKNIPKRSDLINLILKRFYRLIKKSSTVSISLTIFLSSKLDINKFFV